MTRDQTIPLGIAVQLNLTYENALLKTIDALKVEGFGVLTEIDVKETLKKKLNVDYPPYKILGACNPPLAYRALTAAPEVGNPVLGSCCLVMSPCASLTTGRSKSPSLIR
jgi:uncharacterized protein (DUF302 family)